MSAVETRPAKAPSQADAVVQIRGLRKTYRDKEAVCGIDLDVRRGEIFTFLGPNGAGKTTTVEILEGYRSRDAGEVEVLGRDPASPTREWRSRIGVVLQTCDVWPELTVSESLSLFARYYPEPLSVDRTLELVGLQRDRDRRAGQLSGGQKRRLDVGLALVGNPELLFLDEPTTGFDPSARHHAWEVIAGLRELGKTVFLTTHYMDEAEALADRVAVIVDGLIVAEGAPHEIGGRDRERVIISFRLPDAVETGELPIPPGDELHLEGELVEVRTAQPTATVAVLGRWAVDHDLELAQLEVHRPTLEDIYLRLTDGR